MIDDWWCVFSLDNVNKVLYFENFFAGRFSCTKTPESQIKLDFPLFQDIKRVDTPAGKLDIPDVCTLYVFY